MALGLSESSTQLERIDEHFLACVQRTLGRSLTSAEEKMAIAVRDQHDYSVMEAATEILAHAAVIAPTPIDVALVNLTRKKTAGLVAAFRAGEPKATAKVLELLGDYLTDEQVVATLVLESLAGTNSLQGVITDLIWTECEEQAQAELTAKAWAPPELTTVDRIHRYLDSVAA